LLEESPQAFAGEVIVSAETAKRECAQFGNDPLAELLLYVIHGTLHLVGYNDKSAAETTAMRTAEARYLALARCSATVGPAQGEPAK
jgi:probable rRNA maturation factor